MRIEENRVFVFTFNTGDHGDLSIPVRGDSRESASQALMSMFARMQTELAMESPKTSPSPSIPESGAISSADGLESIVLDRINVLMADLGGADLKGAALAETIKNWTDLAFEPANYSSIVHELELIASGQKQVPKKSKKA